MKITFGKHHMASQFGANLHILLFLYVLKHILLIFNLYFSFFIYFSPQKYFLKGPPIKIPWNSGTY